MYRIALILLLISGKVYCQEQFDLVRDCYEYPPNSEVISRYGLSFYTLTKRDCFQSKMESYFGNSLKDDTTYNWQTLLFWNKVSNTNFYEGEINIEVTIAKMQTPQGGFISIMIFMHDINQNELLKPGSKSYKKIKREIVKILNNCR